MMKRYLCLVLVVLLSVPAVSAKVKSGKQAVSELSSIAREYKHRSGDIEVVNVGPVMLKTLAFFAGDDDEEDMEMLRSLKRILVVDYEDAMQSIADEMNAKFRKVLDGCELFMEAREDGDEVYMYGTYSEKDNSIRDLIVFSPSEGQLVCLVGKISVDNIDMVENL